MDLIYDFDETYQELWTKVSRIYEKANLDDREQLLKKYRPIQRDIRDLRNQMEQIIIEIDRGQFNLSKEEQDRIEHDEVIDRAIDRVKPLMLLSLMVENGILEEDKSL